MQGEWNSRPIFSEYQGQNDKSNVSKMSSAVYLLLEISDESHSPELHIVFNVSMLIGRKFNSKWLHIHKQESEKV